MSCKWTTLDMPDLTGKVAIVTGGNAGLGFQSAMVLAQAGCRVVIGCRSNEKGVLAKEKITQACSGRGYREWFTRSD